MYGVTGSPEPINILLIENDETASRRYISQLERGGLTLSKVTVIRDADPVIDGEGATRWDVIIVSLCAHHTAQEAPLQNLKRRHPQASVIVLSAHGSLAQAVECMRLGADDFLIKPVSASQLADTVERNRPARRAVKPTPAATPLQSSLGKLIGASPVMRSLQQILERAAASKATVFLRGESGTGKELCADAVHALSPRKDGPMISLNCSAIPRELMESEVFGHEKGAFTGATHRREGAAELADGGTLFLDEVCEMDMALQAKFLRFIQTGQFTRVGGSTLQTVDVRFVCATNKNPLEAVQAGAFREDLFYRLHVLPVILPPLRERERDILDIAHHALRQFCTEEDKFFHRFDAEVESLLMKYWWPGNVRELLNVIRNVVVMNDGTTVTANMIPLAMAHASGQQQTQVHASPFCELTPAQPDASQANQQPILKPLWQHEQDIIERAIAACEGNIGKAAAHLDINPSTIYRKRLNWTQSGAA